MVAGKNTITVSAQKTAKSVQKEKRIGQIKGDNPSITFPDMGLGGCVPQKWTVRTQRNATGDYNRREHGRKPTDRKPPRASCKRGLPKNTVRKSINGSCASCCSTHHKDCCHHGRSHRHPHRSSTGTRKPPLDARTPPRASESDPIC